jgi:DNA invertase Pin-like site-specific DNA recombinase
MKIGYVRVSTFEQSETDALEQQTARVKKAGAALIFSDTESGKSDKRSQFNKMLDLCRSGGVTEVIVTRIDRLGRSVTTVHKTLAFFEESGIKLNILDAPIDDVSSPFGWFSASQMAQLAEFESRLLSSRIKHGMAYFREQKKASPRPPYGFIRVDERYAPDPDNWKNAIAIVDFFLTPNATLRSTANYSLSQFNKKWTLPGLRYWFNSPVIRGHTAYNLHGNLSNPEKWEIHRCTHTPLISDQTYTQIVRRLEENRTKYAYGGNKLQKDWLPLQGQIICSCCGYKCYIKAKWSTLRVRCKQHDTQGNNFCSNSVSTYLPDIIRVVDAALMARMEKISQLTATSIPDNGEQPEIIALQQQITLLRSLPKSTIIDNAVTETLLEIERLKHEQVSKNTVDALLVEKLNQAFSDLNYWYSLPDAQKREVYLSLVSSVSVANGSITQIFLLV